MMDSSKTNNPIRVPHPLITEYYTSEIERTNFVRQMFNATANDYDRIEHMLALGSGQWYRGQALQRAGLKSGMRVLDVGFGTGLVAIKAIEIIGSPELLTGIDPSSGMMLASPLIRQVQLIEGRAERIPLSENRFDFLSMGYALRHMSDLEQVFSEFFRVLKPGGKICILEITKPETSFGITILKAYMRTIIPLLAKRVSISGDNTPQLWRYYWDSIEACISPEKIIQILECVGFSSVKRHRELGIFTEYQASKP